MIRINTAIEGIPAILWGPPSERLFIAIHGAMSRKDDEVIAVLAEEAVAKDHRVLSFDLPEHGDRVREGRARDPMNCVDDLLRIAAHAEPMARNISLFACSMGAYFGLRAYQSLPLQKALFLSPVVDMKLLIDAMMAAAGVDEARLVAGKRIPMPQGPALDWDYYSDVKSHPIRTWPISTSILYGGRDNLTGWESISAFAGRFGCDLRVVANGEHFFHTAGQIKVYRQWLRDVL